MHIMSIVNAFGHERREAFALNPNPPTGSTRVCPISPFLHEALSYWEDALWHLWDGEVPAYNPSVPT